MKIFILKIFVNIHLHFIKKYPPKINNLISESLLNNEKKFVKLCLKTINAS